MNEAAFRLSVFLLLFALLGLVDLPGGQKAGESTTKLNVSEFAEYVTKVTAYAATELGVIFE